MIRNNHTTAIVLAAVFFAGLSVPAEMELWTRADGTSFEAEFVMDMTGYAIFRDAEGNEDKIQLDQLSEESLTQIDLKDPPKLEFDLVKNQNKVSFSGGNARVGYHPPVYRVHYGARVFTRSNGTYEYPLDLEVYVIGQERLGQKYILLDQFNVTFRLTEENNKKFEYENKRVVTLRDYYAATDEPRGEDYAGYLAIIKDMRGEVVATFSSPKWLARNVETLRERRIGNFMDNKCVRTFPTRPKAYF